MAPRTRSAALRGPFAVTALAAAFGALQATMFYVGFRTEPGQRVPPLGRLLSWQVGSWMVWGALAPAILALGARVRPERPWRWLGVHLPAALVAATLHALAASLIQDATQPFGARQGTLMAQAVGRLTSSLQFEILIYFAILGVSYAIDYYRSFQDRELRAAQLAAHLTEARLEALRLQLQPHFLFNALHTVAGLVRQGDNAGAVEMLARLGDLLRATLDGTSRPLVTLREELALADLYLAILEVRFADRLRVEREIDPALLDAAVPPFLLQPLLENAVRHGLRISAEAGRLRIAAERAGADLRVEVHDDGRGPSLAPGTQSGLGLANIRSRLSQHFGARARLDLLPHAGGTVARLTLPYAPLAPLEEG